MKTAFSGRKCEVKFYGSLRKIVNQILDVKFLY